MKMRLFICVMFLALFAMNCKKENNEPAPETKSTTESKPAVEEKKADPAFKEKALSEYIKQYGNAECAKKEIDGALKDCNEDMDCIHNKINQNCNL
ncbi:MAG: hypothetical protein H7A25_18330 [Leptospiraceae bacterium]|nr:hypothetical protein [Leptospiraceae bacterium]MCP5501865.1 hypothetical protein [Leptospiraceae bacterium]